MKEIGIKNGQWREEEEESGINLEGFLRVSFLFGLRGNLVQKGNASKEI